MRDKQWRANIFDTWGLDLSKYTSYFAFCPCQNVATMNGNQRHDLVISSREK